MASTAVPGDGDATSGSNATASNKTINTPEVKCSRIADHPIELLRASAN